MLYIVDCFWNHDCAMSIRGYGYNVVDVPNCLDYASHINWWNQINISENVPCHDQII